MTDKFKIALVYSLSALFILLNAWLVYKEMYWGVFIPVAFIFVLLFIFDLENVLLMAVFATPIAINIGDYDLGASISLPSEPLLIGILFFFVLKLLLDKSRPDKRLAAHPVSIAIIIYLGWMLVTSIMSDLPVVSFKYLLARVWFIVPVYFGGLMLFRNKLKIKTFVWAYIAALLIVIVITTVRHSAYGFSEKAGRWVMDPFYNDHTAYGVILALFLPIMVGLALDRDTKSRQRLLSAGAALVLLMALYLSYSRAAWLSVGVAIGVLILVLLKIKFRWIATGVVVVLAIFFTFKFEILDRLEKNKQDASANFVEHLQSISNISSDASNLERINRWQAALRLYNARPLTGWGPGTYQFEYAPFQRSSEKTIISTNLGDMGNAHSEYIGPLAEMGFPGMITVLLIMVAALYTGFKVYHRSRDRQIRLWSLSITLGLITYYIHGTMNNFLDTDKASVPFWGLIAALVAMDLYFSKTESAGIETADKPKLES